MVSVCFVVESVSDLPVTNPIRYPKNKVCPACTRLPDFDKKMKELNKA